MARPLRVQQRKDVEEVPADLPRRSVIVRDLPPVGIAGRQQDEGSLDALRDAELSLQQLRVG
jgi:hypothetical protein